MQQAINYLMDEIENAINKRRGKYYTLLTDHKKAYDHMLITKIKDIMGEIHQLAIIIENILTHNIVETDNRISKSNLPIR